MIPFIRAVGVPAVAAVRTDDNKRKFGRILGDVSVSQPILMRAKEAVKQVK